MLGDDETQMAARLIKLNVSGDRRPEVLGDNDQLRPIRPQGASAKCCYRGFVPQHCEGRLRATHLLTLPLFLHYTDCLSPRSSRWPNLRRRRLSSAHSTGKFRHLLTALFHNDQIFGGRAHPHVSGLRTPVHRRSQEKERAAPSSQTLLTQATTCQNDKPPR